MSRIYAGFSLCLIVLLNSSAWASDETAEFRKCVDAGERPAAECFVHVSTPPSSANPFQGLLTKVEKENGDNSDAATVGTIGARIWTPSAAERFQAYLRLAESQRQAN